MAYCPATEMAPPIGLALPSAADLPSFAARVHEVGDRVGVAGRSAVGNRRMYLRRGKFSRFAGSLVLLFSPAAVRASPAIDVVINAVDQAKGDDWASVDLLIVNNRASNEMVALPDRLAASVAGDAPRAVEIERAPGVPATIAVPARGFARARYRLALSAGLGSGPLLVSIPAWRTQQVALKRDVAPGSSFVSAVSEGRVAPASAPPLPAQASAASAPRAALLDRLSAYQPVYAAYGRVSDSEIKIQLSFKYRAAGSDAAASALWQDGLYLAYTQMMLWDRAGDSEFHDVNYIPEIFYRSRSIAIAPGLDAGFQIGAKHESNGRSGPLSRSLNTVYVGSALRWGLERGFFVTVEPRLTFLVGGRHDNPDIRAYRGVSGLNVRIGQEDGLQLSANGRLNASNGRGALVTQLSYPLPQLTGRAPQLYLFGENFVGYGESLVDYRRRMTRLRIGLAVIP